MKNGAYPNFVSSNNPRALSIALECGFFDIVTILLLCGAEEPHSPSEVEKIYEDASEDAKEWFALYLLHNRNHPISEREVRGIEHLLSSYTHEEITLTPGNTRFEIPNYRQLI